jgi:uncharacterized protein YecE (DUF72 family)
MSVVPEGFTFHIKVFGLIPSRSIGPTALPRDLRDLLTSEQAASPKVALSAMAPALVDAVWERMNAAVDVLYQGGKLGTVVFQFHPSFKPTADTFAYLAECRRRLYAAFPMAIEFRDRSWFSTGPATASYPDSGYADPAQASPVFASQREATLYFLRRLGSEIAPMINAPSDDLVEEWPSHEAPPVREPGPAGYGRALIVHDALTSPAAA